MQLKQKKQTCQKENNSRQTEGNNQIVKTLKINRVCINGKDIELCINPLKKSETRAVLSPVFSTKKQERAFAKSAKKCMSIEAKLKW